MELGSAIVSFLTHVKVEKGLAINTHSAYKRDLAKFEEFAKKRKLELAKISRNDLVDFLAGLYRQKLESKTVARNLVSLRNFFRYAQILEAIVDGNSRMEARHRDCGTARCWKFCIRRDYACRS